MAKAGANAASVSRDHREERESGRLRKMNRVQTQTIILLQMIQIVRCRSLHRGLYSMNEIINNDWLRL